jgi:hypothetical protein
VLQFRAMAAKKTEHISEDEITAMIVKRMEDAGWDPAFIYAFRKTGLLVSEGSMRRFSKTDLKKWKDAVAEYRRAHPDD